MSIQLPEQEHHADPLDRASEIQDDLNTEGIQRVTDKLKPEFHPDFDGAHCIECGNDMPDFRLRMQRIRCVGCQTEIEKRVKQYA